ncbi:MAG: glycosyltransferase [Pseudomonadota bacterium]
MTPELRFATGPRVLHIGKYFPPVAGGIESFLSDLLQGLEREGVHTAALVHDDGRFKKSPGEVHGVGSIYRAPSHGNLLYAPVSPGFPVVLASVLRTFNPDLLHLHLPNTSAFWVLISRHARRIPWVIHWHADVVPSKIDTRMALAYKLYQPFERALLRRARSVIVTSRPYLETSLPLRAYRSKTHVIPLGLNAGRYGRVDPQALDWAGRLWGPKRQLRVLTIGRLTYYKGHEILLEAAHRTSGIKVVIVGEGDRRRKLEETIVRLDLGNKVQLTGFLAESKLNALLASCDCFCLPSMERTEAFGMVLLEAMCFGKPVIASHVSGSGVSWVVRHGKTGFLIPSGDVASLSAALTVMANSSHLRAEMGDAAESRFKLNFRIEGVARRISRLYRKLCGTASPLLR